MSSINKIAEIADSLKYRPGMVIPGRKRKYITYVAFISGMLIVDDEDWKGFQSWVSRRCAGLDDYPIGWGQIIADTVIGDERAEGYNWKDMDAYDSERATGFLIELLISYCEEYSDRDSLPESLPSPWADMAFELDKILDPDDGFIVQLMQGRFDAELAERILEAINSIDSPPSTRIPNKLTRQLWSLRDEIKIYRDSVDGEQRVQADDYLNRFRAIVSKKTGLLYADCFRGLILTGRAYHEVYS